MARKPWATGRRNFMKIAGAGALSSAAFTTGVSASSNNDTLLLLSETDTPLTPEQIVDTREEFINQSEADGRVIFQSEETIGDDIAAYMITTDGDSPNERFWPYPPLATGDAKKEEVEKIHATAENEAYGLSIESNDSAIDADPGWDYLGHISYDQYAMRALTEDHIEYMGRMDGLIEMYEADGTEDMRQLGCIVKVDVTPGYYLDQYDSNVDGNIYDWYSATSKVEQNWDEGDALDWDYIDRSPTGNKESNFDGSVSFVVESTGPSLQLELTPSGDDILYENQSDPSNTVETAFEFGAGSQETQAIVGNEGIFMVDDGNGANDTPLRVRTNAEFWAWVGAGYEPDYQHTGRNYGVTLSDLN